MFRNFSISQIRSIISMKPIDPIPSFYSRVYREYWIEPYERRWVIKHIEPYDILRRRIVSTHIFKFTARWKVKYLMWAERRIHTEDRRRWSQVECYRHPEDCREERESTLATDT